MIKPTEKFNFSEPIFNTTKLGLIRSSVYNSVFNVNKRNNQFLYASTVFDGVDALAEPLSSNTNGETWAKPHTNNNTNTNTNSNSNITSVLNYNYKGIPLFYSTITSGAYELTEIAELIKEETNGNVVMKPDKNTMKCIIEIKQGARSLDIEKSIASLLRFRKILHKPGKYTSQIIDIMSFSTINIYCSVISGVKDNGNNTDILYTFTLIETPGYLISTMPTNILYQNVKNKLNRIY